ASGAERGASTPCRSRVAPGSRSTRALDASLGGAGGALLGVREDLDDLAVEARDVGRLAAGDEVPVDDDLLVDPVRAGVTQVALQRRPGRDPTPPQGPGLDQRPGPV